MTEPLNKPSAANGCSSGKTAGLLIAVFADGSHSPAVPYEAERVIFYAKRDVAWAETASQQIQPLDGTAPDAAASFLTNITALVGDAQAVAGASVSGQLYTALNRLGKHIFEISEITPEQLSGIAEDIAAEEARCALAAEAFAVTRPVETEIQGVYSLDLVTALETYPELSSKMILKPFLKNTPFTELSIICRHLPPWLPLETELTVRLKQRGEYLIVTVTKRQRGEAAL